MKRTKSFASIKSIKGRYLRIVLIFVLCISLGALTGELIFQGLAYISGSSSRAVERAVNEFFLDYQMLTGALEKKIGDSRKLLENHYDVYREESERIGVDWFIKNERIEQLVSYLEFVEKRFDFTERLIQFRDRFSLRILVFDKTVEDIQPKILRDINDSIRKLHGMLSGEQFELHRDALIHKTELLCELYASLENSERLSLSLVKEISNHFKELNNILENDELENLEEEFRSLIIEMDKLPDNIGKVNRGLRVTNPLEEKITLEKIASLKEIASQYLSKTRVLNSALTESEKIQNMMARGAMLTDALRTRDMSYFEELIKKGNAPDEMKENIVNYHESLSELINELRLKGYEFKTRKETIETDTISNVIANLVTNSIANPVRWLLIILGLVFGISIGSKLNRLDGKRQLKKLRAEVRRDTFNETLNKLE